MIMKKHKTVLNVSGTYSNGKDGYHVDAGTKLKLVGDYGNTGLYSLNIGGSLKELKIPYKNTVIEEI